MVIKYFCFIVSFLFCLILISAEVNLVVTATANGTNTSVFLQTNEKATPGYDVYDLEYPPFPGERTLLFSSLENHELIMDSWNSSDRKLALVYTRNSQEDEEVVLDFTGDLSSTFKIILEDYGDDARFFDVIASESVKGNSQYETMLTSLKHYYLLDINYLFCGDGYCSSGESCSMCPIDCSCEDVEGEIPTNTYQQPLHVLSRQELLEGFDKPFGIDEGYSFVFFDTTYTVIVQSLLADSATLVITNVSEPVVLTEKFIEDIDLDSDGTFDITLASNAISENKITLFIQGINSLGFGDASLDDVRSSPKRSIFDETYSIARVDVPVRTIILVSVLLIVSIWLVVILFFVVRHIRRKRIETQEVPVS